MNTYLKRLCSAFQPRKSLNSIAIKWECIAHFACAGLAFAFISLNAFRSRLRFRFHFVLAFSLISAWVNISFLNTLSTTIANCALAHYSHSLFGSLMLAPVFGYHRREGKRILCLCMYEQRMCVKRCLFLFCCLIVKESKQCIISRTKPQYLF